jgi:chromosome segregation ATPase
VVADPAEALGHAAELEHRDEDVAGRLARIRGLAERTASLRERAAMVHAALDELPRELDGVEGRLRDAAADVTRAEADAEAAASRVAALEAGRRRSDDELDRARSEAQTARQRLVDAGRELDRLTAQRTALRGEVQRRETERGALVVSAADVARELREVPQLNDPALHDPGVTLPTLEEWAARARAALFVVQGTLETERERIVVEANALGTAVLGESLGASSVAVVRRRLEEALG